MSRDDMVFTKRAMVVVAVVSVLGSQLVGGFVAGFRTAGAQEEVVQKATAAATAAAVAAVQSAVAPVREAQVRHEAEDNERQRMVEYRLGIVERTGRP